jgi:phenylacetate-CoA ligase
VTREGSLDEVEVRCEMLPGLAVSVDRAALARSLSDRIKTLVGISARVDVGLPDSIERTLVGKARRVVDKRPK